MMKRILFSILLCISALSLPTYAIGYSDLLEDVATRPPYDALYKLSAYQQQFPTHANPYYQMGNIAYNLMQTMDALHHYDELTHLYYTTRLYYGNCLHFASMGSFKDAYYDAVPRTGKKLTYEQLESFLRSRMDSITIWSAQTDSIHHTFYRMVNRYNECNALFTDIIETQPRQKMAHMCLSDSMYQQLLLLQDKTATLPTYISEFQQALALQPVAGYLPSFSFRPIELYRIDGLTSTDFLVNDVVLWDYATWTKEFLSEQQQTYQRLYTDIIDQYNGMLEWQNAYPHAGTMLPDIKLLNRIEQVDYQSPISAFLSIQQIACRVARMTLDPVWKNDSLPLAEIKPLLLQAQLMWEAEKSAYRYREQLHNRLSNYTLEMYRPLYAYQHWTKAADILPIADSSILFIHNRYHGICQQLYRYTLPYAKPFDGYSDDVSLQQWTATYSVQETDTLPVLVQSDASNTPLNQYTLPYYNAKILALIPMGENKVIFLKNDNRIFSVRINEQGTISPDIFMYPEIGVNEWVTAIKLSSRTIVLMYNKPEETILLFTSADGRKMP